MTALRIAQHTTDELPLGEALPTAPAYGAAWGGLAGPEVRPGRSVAARLYDLKTRGSPNGQARAREHWSFPTPLPLVVRGDHFESLRLKVLRTGGVLLSGPFDPEVFRALRQASEDPRKAERDPENRDSRGEAGDPAVLCGMVRSLACHAHRALQRSPDGTLDVLPDVISKLRDRMARVQEQIDLLRRQHDLQLEELQRWLDALRRRVEGAPASAPRATEK